MPTYLQAHTMARGFDKAIDKRRILWTYTKIDGLVGEVLVGHTTLAQQATARVDASTAGTTPLAGKRAWNRW